MNTKKRIAWIAVAAAMLLLLGSCRNSEPAKLGTTAPDFTVTDARRTVQLSQFRGKPVLVHFWATWCPPCVEEAPVLAQFQRQVGDKVTVIAVSMDQDDAAYQAFVGKHMAGVLTVRDGERKSAPLFGTFAYPESFLIDKNGKIQRKFIGAADWTSPEMIDYFNKM